MYSGPHACYNLQLHSTDTRGKSQKNETVTFRRENISDSLKGIAKEESFHLKTKYKYLCECSQILLHLENYHQKQAVALFS